MPHRRGRTRRPGVTIQARSVTSPSPSRRVGRAAGRTLLAAGIGFAPLTAAPPAIAQVMEIAIRSLRSLRETKIAR